jgi:hypothetical protein
MAETEIVHEDSTLRIGVTRNLVAFAWSAAPEATHVRSLTRALQAVIGKHGSNHAALDIVLSGAPRFSDEVRSEMVKLIRDPRIQGQGSAHVVEVAGLSGTAVRAFLSTVLLMGRPAAPHKVFGSLGAGAAWLASVLSKVGQAWTTAEILKAAAAVTAPRQAR